MRYVTKNRWYLYLHLLFVYKILNFILLSDHFIKTTNTWLCHLYYFQVKNNISYNIIILLLETIEHYDRETEKELLHYRLSFMYNFRFILNITCSLIDADS